MARKKKKKSNKPKLSKEQQRFINTRKNQKTKDLASLPSSNKTADNSGVVALDQIQGSARTRSDHRKGGRTYGWVEDHPTDPDKVIVKNRFLSDNPEGRDEQVWGAAGLEEGRPDGGSRIGNKPKYNENYDEVFGNRKRGVAAGHKVFKKKYK